MIIMFNILQAVMFTVLLVFFLLVLLGPFRYPLANRVMTRIMNVEILSKARRLSALSQFTRQRSEPFLVFLGDSLTEHFPLYELFWDKPVINRGIAGDTCNGVLSRLEDDVIALNPAKIFLQIGINDLGSKLGKAEDIPERIFRIILELKARLPETDLYLISLYPVNSIDFTSFLSQQMVKSRPNVAVEEINKQLEENAKKYAVHYIDIAAKMRDERGELKKEFSTEGLHLTFTAYEMIAKELRGYL